MCLCKVNTRYTRKKVWNIFKVNNTETRMTSYFHLNIWIFRYVTSEHILTPFSSVSIVNFEQVIVCWVKDNKPNGPYLPEALPLGFLCNINLINCSIWIPRSFFCPYGVVFSKFEEIAFTLHTYSSVKCGRNQNYFVIA